MINFLIQTILPPTETQPKMMIPLPNTILESLKPLSLIRFLKTTQSINLSNHMLSLRAVRSLMHQIWILIRRAKRLKETVNRSMTYWRVVSEVWLNVFKFLGTPRWFRLVTVKRKPFDELISILRSSQVYSADKDGFATSSTIESWQNIIQSMVKS